MKGSTSTKWFFIYLIPESNWNLEIYLIPESNWNLEKLEGKTLPNMGELIQQQINPHMVSMPGFEPGR